MAHPSNSPIEVHVHPPWDRPPLPGPVRPLCAGCRFGDARPNQWLRPSAGCRFAGLSPNPSRGGPPPSLQTDGPGAAIWRSRATTTPALASNRCPRSSRICPANDRETLRNDGNCRSIESAGQASDSAIAAGSEIGPENTLKVESLISQTASTDSFAGRRWEPRCEIARDQLALPLQIPDPGQVSWRSILLVDDVFTTGIRTHFVCEALMAAGAAEVAALVLARQPGWK